MRRVFHRVEVIEVAEELVEPVDGGQELIQIAEVVLAELARGITHGLERGGNRAGLGRNADLGAGLADRGHAGADGQFAGDEVRPARRATRLGVVVGEQHALLGELVEVRRPAGHHAAMVGADVPHADVVAHDDDDVRFLAAGGRLRRRRDNRLPSRWPRRRMAATTVWFDTSLLPWSWLTQFRSFGCGCASLAV